MWPVDSRASIPREPDDVDKLQFLLRKNPEAFFERFSNIFVLSEASKERLDNFVSGIVRGLIPIIYANHQSPADKLALSLVTDYIKKRVSENDLQGFSTIVAVGSQQSEYFRRLNGFLNPIFEARGIVADMPFISANDRDKRGIVGSNREALVNFLAAPNKKVGVLLFPEGTTEGGKADQDGNILGM